MEFDRFTLVFLITNPLAPQRSDFEENQIQNAHMANLAKLHHSGHLIAAGPTGDLNIRGVCLFRSDVDESRELMLADPAVAAGEFTIDVIPWYLPKGEIVSGPGRPPQSISEI
jgi:uncharacterized protein